MCTKTSYSHFQVHCKRFNIVKCFNFAGSCKYMQFFKLDIFAGSIFAVGRFIDFLVYVDIYYTKYKLALFRRMLNLCSSKQLRNSENYTPSNFKHFTVVDYLYLFLVVFINNVLLYKDQSASTLYIFNIATM